MPLRQAQIYSHLWSLVIWVQVQAVVAIWIQVVVVVVVAIWVQVVVAVVVYSSTGNSSSNLNFVLAVFADQYWNSIVLAVFADHLSNKFDCVGRVCWPIWKSIESKTKTNRLSWFLHYQSPTHDEVRTVANS